MLTPLARRIRRAVRPLVRVPYLEVIESRQLLAAHLGSQTFATIQAAVDAAGAGAIITVDAGTYNELVTVNKSLALKGARAGIDARDTSRGFGESVVRGTLVGAVRSTGFHITA